MNAQNVAKPIAPPYPSGNMQEQTVRRSPMNASTAGKPSSVRDILKST